MFYVWVCCGSFFCNSALRSFASHCIVSLTRKRDSNRQRLEPDRLQHQKKGGFPCIYFLPGRKIRTALGQNIRRNLHHGETHIETCHFILANEDFEFQLQLVTLHQSPKFVQLRGRVQIQSSRLTLNSNNSSELT